MFFSGVFLKKGQETAVALIEKIPGKLKKHYCIHNLDTFPGGMHQQVADEMQARYHDNRLIRMKKVFSQNRRPAKKVAVHPVAVIGFPEEEASERCLQMVNCLREVSVPVEAVFVITGPDLNTSLQKDNPPWRREDYRKICLGNNYYVTEHLIMACLAGVLPQNRLSVRDGNGKAGQLINDLKETGYQEPVHPYLMAAALPVWFHENVHVIRRY